MTDLSDVAALDATDQAALVRAGEVTATELVQAAIDRAEAVNGELNAIIHPRYERALEEAAAVSGDAPFAGVPFVLKDLDGTAAGEPLHAGTRFLKDHGYVATTDSELTTRFRDAGLIVIGRTNTPELGLVTTTEPLSHGPSRNPWDPTRSTGGSSGGSAAATAAGIVPMAHAGDGGGSIRIPAAECGLVGLKPTRGRSSLGPELGEAWAGLVTRLAVTHTVRDTAAILDAVAGPGVGDPYWAPPPARPYAAEVGADPGSLRIGWVAQPPDGSFVTDPQVEAATEATATLLESLGHRVEQAYPSSFDDPGHVANFLVTYSAWVARELDHLAELVGAPLTEDGFEPGTWAIAEGGRAVTASAYLAALDGLHAMTRATVAWWEVDGFDLLLTPTIPELPPTLGQFGATPDNPLAGVFRSTPIVTFTAPFNITGQPGISLPLHQSAEGLPIGVQLVSAPAREDVLIRIAAQLEQAAPWADRRPQVWTGAR
ncbi:amidase [Aquihabitans sp. G128]|uniref:amidase n=1 Tax=Aquihabitans sp. G128 TaxID=2849779 RepID=UPI001C241B09|nr:amidase [Aquihabitans sp. G128]QXC59162.1 amidase [Aquihabitans sp. G128]